MRTLLVFLLFPSLALAEEAVPSVPLRPVAVIEKPQPEPSQAGLLEEVSADIARMQAGLAQAGSSLAQGAAMYQRYDQQLAAYLRQVLAAATGNAAALAGLAVATKQMQETQMSFNLQYLQLQSQMQDENRQYTMISNVMKTKHDTVKNSISNVR